MSGAEHEFVEEEDDDKMEASTPEPSQTSLPATSPAPSTSILQEDTPAYAGTEAAKGVP